MPATRRALTCRTFVAAPKTELAAAWREIPRDGVAVMAERLRMGLFWRILDALDYWLTQARLWVVDVVCGPV